MNDFLSLLSITSEHVLIGSRAYMPAPYSDYDYMFHSHDQQNVMEALINKNVSFETNAFGTIKLSVKFGEIEKFGPLQPLKVHFCFVEDFDAWKKATELMKIASSNTKCFEGWPKKNRLDLFADFVVLHGGKRPQIIRY
jgi:hypothetical protein